MFRLGLLEVIVGSSIAHSFQGVGLQGTLNWGMRAWTVVGVFDAGNTGLSSEIREMWIRSCRRSGGPFVFADFQALKIRMIFPRPKRPL